MRRVTIDHIDIRVRDLGASRTFYEAALKPLGLSIVTDRADEVDFGFDSLDDFGIHSGGVPSTGVHVAFLARSAQEVDEFYRAALAVGASSDAPPGLHPEYSPGYYAAFVLDPDGNVVEAVCMGVGHAEGADAGRPGLVT
ncbi:MAG TPA: VOC family protein [Candidatus Eremiobacteraceae bacterium]|nr:VOC family protein [Candidatus Eremiobacteraceae bacterium]